MCFSREKEKRKKDKGVTDCFWMKRKILLLAYGYILIIFFLGYKKKSNIIHEKGISFNLYVNLFK